MASEQSGSAVRRYGAALASPGSYPGSRTQKRLSDLPSTISERRKPLTPLEVREMGCTTLVSKVVQATIGVHNFGRRHKPTPFPAVNPCL